MIKQFAKVGTDNQIWMETGREVECYTCHRTVRNTFVWLGYNIEESAEYAATFFADDDTECLSCIVKLLSKGLEIKLVEAIKKALADQPELALEE